MKSAAMLGMAAGLFAMAGCATSQPTLKDAFKNKFLIGAALNKSQFTEQNLSASQKIMTDAAVTARTLHRRYIGMQKATQTDW